MKDSAVAAIEYAVNAEEGIEYLRLWLHGDFESCRKEWPDAPQDCYRAADPFWEQAKTDPVGRPQ